MLVPWLILNHLVNKPGVITDAEQQLTGIVTFLLYQKQARETFGSFVRKNHIPEGSKLQVDIRKELPTLVSTLTVN